ncbi:hypothetical protein HELRODRAFT_62245, partial [Helobdella robusta]|uniref:Anoctamin n=1 Tax=Helobdella robusta TaxID=6412 RepID=T1FWX8_HELRO
VFFNDGVRRIDYILVWSSNKARDKRAATKESFRKTFVNNLIEEGLHVEEDIEESRNVQFAKVHAPFEVLARHTDNMKLKMPIKEVSSKIEDMDSMGLWGRMTGCFKKFLSPFELDPYRVPHFTKKFTCTFQKEKMYLYDVPTPKENFFSRATRCRIVDFILRRTEYGHEHQSLFTYGIKNLIANGTYLSAYPLHEGSHKNRSRMSIRKLLHDNWASSSVWFKVQPLDYIRSYFGEKIGFYFAWLGYYTYALIPASIVGLLVFIYGLVYINSDPIAKDSCEKNMFIMCPKCYKRCSFWGYHRMCYYILVTHLFDNAATVFFAAFMSLWGTIFLEFWKREQASIQYLWDLKNFEEEEEPPRPEYLVKISESKYTKKNKVTGVKEPYHPFWKRKMPVYLTSASVMFFLILVAIAVVLGVTAYRIAILSVMYTNDHQMVYKNAPLIGSISAAIINLILIFILNFVYEKLAIKLTDWECLRTQHDYDNSLRYKIYILQFVNFYSSLFYIAFIKGRFNGPPNERSKIFNARLEECDGGSCLTELCIQLAIIFVGKQLIQNNLVEIVLPFVSRIKRAIRMCLRNKNKKLILKPWEKDFNLEEMGSLGLLQEYLEMMIQFGFVTLFVAAFPLAPCFAFINNLIEIRSDANKFVTQYRRPMPARAVSIGVWYEILHAITRISIVTNACIIAFTSSFIQRELYKRVYSSDNTLNGFLNNSLAYFDVNDFVNGTAPKTEDIKEKYKNTTYCRYLDYREPPWSAKKYQYTTQYWHLMASQFIFVVLFENIIVLITCFVAYLIPDTSTQVSHMMRREAVVVNEILLKTELNRAKGFKPGLSKSSLNEISHRINASEGKGRMDFKSQTSTESGNREDNDTNKDDSVVDPPLDEHSWYLLRQAKQNDNNDVSFV